MEMPEIITGLNPKEFYGKKQIIAKIVGAMQDGDCISVSTKQGKNGEFLSYSMSVQLDNGEIENLNYLMGSQLQKLRRTYGKNSLDWIGKNCILSVSKVGEFFNWKIADYKDTPEEEFIEG